MRQAAFSGGLLFKTVRIQSMDFHGLLADIVVDVISEGSITEREPAERSYKKGFFHDNPYLLNRTSLKNRRTLITEKNISDLIMTGRKSISIHKDSIVTPLAKLMIEEGGIIIEKG